MPESIRTVRLGRPFQDNGRSIIINLSRISHRCTCGISLHQIAPGELYAVLRNPHTKQREYWHAAHLQKNWKLIVLDPDDDEVARFGC